MDRKTKLDIAAKDFANTFDEQIHINTAKYIGFIKGANWSDDHPKKIIMSAADRGTIDEIIFALKTLGNEKMISYAKEIKFLNKIRKL